MIRSFAVSVEATERIRFCAIDLSLFCLLGFCDSPRLLSRCFPLRFALLGVFVAWVFLVTTLMLLTRHDTAPFLVVDRSNILGVFEKMN